MPLYNFTDTELVNDCFDKLIAQGGCSHAEGRPDSCLYRAPNGRKCALGLYIPDEEYKTSLEGKMTTGCNSPSNDLNAICRSIGLVPAKMMVLQCQHDRAASAPNPIEELQRMRVVLLAKIESGMALEDIGRSAI